VRDVAVDSEEMKNDPTHRPAVTIEATRFDERGTVLTVDGELDLPTLEQFDAAIAAELAADCNRLVIDLSGTTFMGSTAMGVLLRRVAELRDDGCAAVVLVTSPGITRRALEVSGVLALFSAYATRAEAVAAVRDDQPLGDAWRRLQPAS
jgi:anti-sigma B factor antagonist